MCAWNTASIEFKVALHDKNVGKYVWEIPDWKKLGTFIHYIFPNLSTVKSPKDLICSIYQNREQPDTLLSYKSWSLEMKNGISIITMS